MKGVQETEVMGTEVISNFTSGRGFRILPGRAFLQCFSLPPAVAHELEAELPQRMLSWGNWATESFVVMRPSRCTKYSMSSMQMMFSLGWASISKEVMTGKVTALTVAGLFSPHGAPFWTKGNKHVRHSGVWVAFRAQLSSASSSRISPLLPYRRLSSRGPL